MTGSAKQFLFCTPRMICILFAVFVSIFAFDVFDEGHSFLETIVALSMHLIPTGIIVIALIVSWRWEWIGAILFVGLAVFYLVWSWGRFPWVTYLTISGPLFLVGALFLFNWVYRAELRAR